MTTTSPDTHASADLRLGRDVVRRMRLPGPPVGRPLPSRIGSLASSVSRFAAATSRPVDVRRALIGPDPRGLAGSSAPPRWWTPVAAEPAAESAAPASGSESGSDPVRRTPAWLAPARPVAIRRLPERSLPRAAREVPNEATWSPGGIVGGLRGEVARIRRLDEVAAVGPMLTQNDRAKLNAGLAARNVQQAAAQQATSQPAVARRATTRTPRQPAAAASAPSASEPPTAPPGASAPGSGAPATVPPASAPGSVAPAPPAGSATAAPAATPGSGAPATVSPASAPSSVAPSPPAGTVTAATPGSGASAPVPPTSAPGSVAPAPPAGAVGPAPGPAPLRRVARPSWQLRSQQSRFDGLVRRTPIGHATATATASSSGSAGASASGPAGLSSVVARLASPDRARPAGGDGARSTTLESSVRGSEVVTAAGPGLIAGSIDAPATVRRHAWSAGSLVMRQAAGARAAAGTLGAARATVGATPSTPTPAPRSASAPAPAPAGPLAATPAVVVPAPATPAPATPAPAASGSTSSSPAAPGAAPAARTAEPVVRRLPSAVGSAAAPVPDAAAGAQTSGGFGTVSAAGTVPDPPPPGTGSTVSEAPAVPVQQGLRRLWRRATDVRPATDVRTSTPAPVVRLAHDPAAASPAGTGPAPTVRRMAAAAAPAANPSTAPTTAGSPATTSVPAASGRSSTPHSTTSPSSPTPTRGPLTAAPAAAAVRRASFPVSRVGAHVASPGIAGAEVGMPELMTIRRATAHGTDSNRTLATGFGAPETIRPAGSPVAAPTAAVAGESRLWRRAVTPTGEVRSFGAAASPAARSLVTAMPVSRTTSRQVAASATARAGAPGRVPAAAGGGSPRFAGAAPAPPVRRTWQPWTDSPSPVGPGAPITTFPAGPPGAASGPTGRTPTPDVRRLTVAPPRISVAPSQPPPPPVPEVARTAPTSLQRTAAGAAPARPSNTASSLVESTAHLFATPDAPLVRRAVQPGGSSMSSLTSPSSPGGPTIRRRYGEDSSSGEMSDTTLSAEATDRLVDKVVERIERRVIEELERRGRSHGRGGY